MIGVIFNHPDTPIIGKFGFDTIYEIGRAIATGGYDRRLLLTHQVSTIMADNKTATSEKENGYFFFETPV